MKRRARAKARRIRVSNIDVSMLRDNLKRSYAERIRRHQIALKMMEKLQKAKFL